MNKFEKLLKELKERMEYIAGSWNGDEDTFNFEGSMISSEVVDVANEVIEKVVEIEKLLLEIEELGA